MAKNNDYSRGPTAPTSLMPSKAEAANTPVASPCVRQCCLNMEEMCVGCGRLLSEIIGWTSYSADEKASVAQIAQQRLKNAT